jgi:hypothetical protein
MAKVRNSSHLLAYYVCDDCDNGGKYPMRRMAAIYTAIKRIDPFHVVMGAPWCGKRHYCFNLPSFYCQPSLSRACLGNSFVGFQIGSTKTQS